MADRCDVQENADQNAPRQDAATLKMIEEAIGAPPKTEPPKKGPCQDQIDAQTNREINKIRPQADSATLQMMYDGLSLSQREEAKREMKEALERELKKHPEPKELKTPEDLAKHGIKVEGDTITFPNGLKFDKAKGAVDTGDPGKPGGIFMIKNVFDHLIHRDHPENPDRILVRKEFYANATDRVGYIDTAGMLLHVPTSNGEFVLNQTTGKITYQANKVLCGGLPQLTLEDAKKANAEARKQQEIEDLNRPWQ